MKPAEKAALEKLKKLGIDRGANTAESVHSYKEGPLARLISKRKS